MSLRSRLLDLLPVVLVFAIVTCFATFVVIEYIVREPLVVPAGQGTLDDGEQPGPRDDARREVPPTAQS